MLTVGTYEGLNPIGHAKDVGMPVIVRGSSGRHLSNIDSVEALCETRGADEADTQNWAGRDTRSYMNSSELASASDVRR